MNSEIAAGLLLLSALLASIAQIMLKKSAIAPHDKAYQAYFNPLVLCAYGILFTTALINMQAFVWQEYRFGAAISSAAYVFVLLWGRLIFKEKISLKRAAGMALILVGILIFVAGG